VTVEVVIPSKDNFDVLAACIDSIVSKTIFDRYRITVVENNSQDPRTFAFYRSLETQGIARVLRFDGPFNFSRINNYAVSTTSADILLFLNNDTEILDSSWMARMIGVATRPEVGVVGAKLLYPNGMVQHSGVVLGLGGLAGHVERYIESHDPGYCGRALFPQEISAVTGACMAVRRRVYLEIGGMDEALRVAFNDIDFCIRVMERGYRNIQLNDVVLIHHESLSRGKDDTPAKKRLFLEESRIIKAKHGQRLAEDRYFNPNLSREGECIRFSAPFRGKSFGCDPLVSPLRHAA
jgi:GT2 family glycosyltransferase